MRLPEAKKVAQKDNTERRGKFPPTAKKFILGFTAIVIIIFGTYLWQQYRQQKLADGQKPIEKVKTAAQATTSDAKKVPIEEWPKWVIPVGGKSEVVPVPPGKHPVMYGKDARLPYRGHVLYEDGSECVWGDPCVAGPMVSTWAVNEAGEENTVYFNFGY